ncbi:hypothetical protein GIB67_021682 [Kingdonia uniflora]|uniref:Uncharacterized protein n=1 Tax=Kingdonia uniflora TaxID=39325 RepID=A0A7J7LM91_9MAGN|nr:hypothetical protein GIB67_021682 [Kingdonia uniflora]
MIIVARQIAYVHFQEREKVYSMSQLQSLKPNFVFLTQEIPQSFSPKDCQKNFVRTTQGVVRTKYASGPKF